MRKLLTKVCTVLWPWDVKPFRRMIPWKRSVNILWREIQENRNIFSGFPLPWTAGSGSHGCMNIMWKHWILLIGESCRNRFWCILPITTILSVIPSVPICMHASLQGRNVIHRHTKVIVKAWRNLLSVSYGKAGWMKIMPLFIRNSCGNHRIAKKRRWSPPECLPAGYIRMIRRFAVWSSVTDRWNRKKSIRVSMGSLTQGSAAKMRPLYFRMKNRDVMLLR